jgi:hypothetical protein
MISLTDDELNLITDLAQPLPAHCRARFVEAVLREAAAILGGSSLRNSSLNWALTSASDPKIFRRSAGLCASLSLR